jgi:hypothetical protein
MKQAANKANSRRTLLSVMEFNILIIGRAAYNFDYMFRGLRGCRAPEGVPLRHTVSTTGFLNTVYSGI